MCQRSLVCSTVYTQSQSTDDQRVIDSKFNDQSFRRLFAVWGGGAGADDSDDPGCVEVGITLVKQKNRRFLQCQEALRIALVCKKETGNAMFLDKAKLFFHKPESVETPDRSRAYPAEPACMGKVGELGFEDRFRGTE